MYIMQYSIKLYILDTGVYKHEIKCTNITLSV